MIGLDTNILVRYLIQDDEQQLSFVPCHLSFVLCELIRVLRGRNYGFTKDEMIQAMEAMLPSPAFEFESSSIVDQALQRYKQGRADFSDYLIGAIAPKFAR